MLEKEKNGTFHIKRSKTIVLWATTHHVLGSYRTNYHFSPGLSIYSSWPINMVLFGFFGFFQLCLSGIMQLFCAQDDQEESVLSTDCSGEKVVSVQVLSSMQDEQVTAPGTWKLSGVVNAKIK